MSFSFAFQSLLIIPKTLKAIREAEQIHGTLEELQRFTNVQVGTFVDRTILSCVLCTFDFYLKMKNRNVKEDALISGDFELIRLHAKLCGCNKGIIAHDP